MVFSFQPGYSPSNHKQLSGVLLNEAATEIEQKILCDTHTTFSYFT